MRHVPFAAMVLCSLVFAAEAAEPATAVTTTTLHNVFKLDDTLYSGNSPDSEEAFRELANLGVKTIISVDGGKPNVALAHKFGMRYVHLPIGYDAVPKSRAVELLEAALGANGPLYIHCHHGKHRGPAAAATICRARDGWSAERADAFLKQAGTAADYAGLFRDVREFRPPTAEELARLPANLPEVSETPDLVDSMVAIDDHLETLKVAQKAGWHSVPGHPDLMPAQPAILLWEHLREIARMADTVRRDDDYRAKLADSERAATALRQLLDDTKGDASMRDAALQRLTKSCTACHQSHRN